MNIKDLKEQDIVLVTNTEKNESAKFLVTPFLVFGLPFWEILRLVELTITPNNNNYPLRYLNRPEIKWEKCL